MDTSSERMMVDSTADVATEGLLCAIVSEIDRLQPVPFDNSTAMFDSLLLNHSRCDSVYLDEMLAKFGPELPALNVGSELDDKPSSGRDIRSPTTNLSSGASSESNFVEEKCVENSPAGNDLQDNSTVLGEELVAVKTQLQQQQDMILKLQKSNSDLKDQVTQQHEMILELRKNSSQQQQHQYEMILELRSQLNTLTEAHRMNEALLDERLLATQEVDQDLTAEISDRTQIEIAEMNVFTTNERTLLNDSGQMGQLQEIEGVQSGAEEWHEGSVIMTGSNDISLDVEQHNKSDRVGQSANSTLSSEEDNLNFIQSEGSMRVKHQTRKGVGKRITYDLDSTEVSHKNRQNSRKKIKTFFCGECSKRFNWKSNFTKHLRVHSGEKPFKCKECDAAFSQSGNLKTHQWIHSNEKPYKCKECNAAFNHLGSFKAHQRIHSNEKPYKCEECDAAFSQSSSLKTHQRIHSNEKPYECKDCDAAFSQLGSLKAHERIHSHEKPYKCKECAAAFTQLGNLKRHQWIHSDEKPFACDICKKSFRQKGTLAIHMDIHSGKKSHKCNVCQKEFRFRSNLKQHLEVHSNEKLAQSQKN